MAEPAEKEFADLPGAILFTTNCLMPPKEESYADRVFSTEVVSYPGVVHVDDGKDFTPVIEKALELGGFGEDRQYKGINGGEKLTTGFGHGTILQAADSDRGCGKGRSDPAFLFGRRLRRSKKRQKLLYGIRINRHRPIRSFLRWRVENTGLTIWISEASAVSLGSWIWDSVTMPTEPSKWQSHLHKLSTAESMDFRLSMVLSWYERKAVCILLTLLHLGIKNIYLGPSLPAFLSPNVLQYLVENYRISPIGDPKEDLEKMLERV